MKIIPGLLICIMFCNTLPNKTIKDLHFLNGTWKVENKQSYETWKMNNDSSLEGNSYKIKDGNKRIDEYLAIKAVAGKLIYTARVLNQNNGQPVDFTMNVSVTDKFSFENMEHDFPKKIQYTKLNDTTLFIAVLGENDKGFSYRMIKQK
ncbi:hypothetical protein IDJ75_03280 [Mucilaginibacter rigui]|uniref:DUF6265 domain-containing protein n=1 Tax=Mucilaginibacter rigui TaxID=534635 RepID=A0ABR7X3E0_9SPHI|nr:DUF6265 family protein [Mucilaginibacter rigui]MBD1384287.1 hypothetical protein [Mucilaginibacter rigui]